MSSSETVDGMSGQMDFLLEFSLSDWLDCFVFLIEEPVSLVNDADSDAEQDQWGNGVPRVIDQKYFFISASMAGGFLAPTLLPYNSSSVYPSKILAF